MNSPVDKRCRTLLRFLLCVLGIAGAAHHVRAANLDTLLTDAVRYADTSEKHAAKLAAREALNAQMPEALNAAMAYVHGDHVMLQVLVMEWVNELDSETVVPVMLDHINHPEERTRRLAIFFLGFHEAPEHANRIIPHLDEESTRGAAIRTLGKWRVRPAVPDIIPWLAEGKERIRVVAANALRDIGDPSAIPALIAALDDPVFTVRNAAARALIALGDDASAALRTEHGDLSPQAKAMRKRCLAVLEDRPFDPPPEHPVVVDGAFFGPSF